jgi:hypothetical protein
LKPLLYMISIVRIPGIEKVVIKICYKLQIY